MRDPLATGASRRASYARVSCLTAPRRSRSPPVRRGDAPTPVGGARRASARPTAACGSPSGRPTPAASSVVGDWNGWGDGSRRCTRRVRRASGRRVVPTARRRASATSSPSSAPTGTHDREGRPDGAPAEMPAVERERRRRPQRATCGATTTWMPNRVASRRGTAAAHLRGAPRLVARTASAATRVGEQLADHCRAPRLHPRRTAARRRASVRRLVGLSGHRLLRADGALRHARRLPRVRRHAAPARHRRDPRLGARPLPEGRVEPRPLRRHRAVRARRPPPGRAPRLGHATCSTTAATRCATSSSPTRSYWLQEFHIDGLRVDAVASMLYLDYSREPGEWVPNRVRRSREPRRRSSSCSSSTRVVGGEVPGGDDDRRGEHGVAEGHPPGRPRRTRLHPQVEHGVDARHARATCKHDPVHRRWHHHELTFGLLYAFTERFVLPLSHDEVVHGKGSLLAQDARRRLAALRQPARALRLDVGAARAHRWCSWAPRWRRATEWNDAAGLPWHLLDHAPAPRRARPARRRSTGCRRRLAGGVGARPRAHRASSGSTPTTPTTRCFAFLRWGSPAAPGGRVRRQLHAGAASRVPGRPAVGGEWQIAARHRLADVRVVAGTAASTVDGRHAFDRQRRRSPWQGQPASARARPAAARAVVLAGVAPPRDRRRSAC